MEETKLWILCTETHYGNSSIATAESINSKSVPQGLLVEFFLGAIVFAVANLVFQRLQIRSSRLPPGPSAWELLFQTYVLRRRTEVVLQNFAKRFGPVIHVRFWSQDMLVISSVAAAEEFYKLHDMEFGARPSSMERSTSISNSVGALCFAPRAAHLKHISLILVNLSILPGESNVICLIPVSHCLSLIRCTSEIDVTLIRERQSSTDTSNG